jgi:hypothetical protein
MLKPSMDIFTIMTLASNMMLVMNIHTGIIHQIRKSPSLKSMTGLAFILGFAHEEEFVILAIAAGSGGETH